MAAVSREQRQGRPQDRGGRSDRRGNDSHAAAIRQAAARLSEVGMVEQVEKLGADADLGRFPVRHQEALGHGPVGIGVAGASELVAARRAEVGCRTIAGREGAWRSARGPGAAAVGVALDGAGLRRDCRRAQRNATLIRSPLPSLMSQFLPRISVVPSAPTWSPRPTPGMVLPLGTPLSSSEWP